MVKRGSASENHRIAQGRPGILKGAFRQEREKRALGHALAKMIRILLASLRDAPLIRHACWSLDRWFPLAEPRFTTGYLPPCLRHGHAPLALAPAYFVQTGHHAANSDGRMR